MIEQAKSGWCNSRAHLPATWANPDSVEPVTKFEILKMEFMKLKNDIL